MTAATLEALEALVEQTDDALARYRLLKHERDLCALQLIADGVPKTHVAEAMGITRQQIYRLIDTKTI